MHTFKNSMKKAYLLGLLWVWPFLISAQTAERNKNVSTNSVENAVQFRIARPTNQLDKIKTFYTQALGMRVLGSFTGHSGYSGVMLGMPNGQYHLEFTQHDEQKELPPPTKENLLVLYFDTPEKYKAANKRIQALGIRPIEPENPYWEGKSMTYEDPDSWRIVLFNGVYRTD